MMQKPLPRFDRAVYLLYIFLLPLGRLFVRPEGAPTTLQIMSASTMVMLFGLSAMTVRKLIEYRGWRLRAFYLLYLFMVVYTLIASFIIYTNTPVYNGVTTLIAPIENLVLYLVVIFSIVYNYNCLSNIYIYIYSVFKTIDRSIWTLLIVGYIQFGAIIGIGPCVAVYSVLSEFLNIVPLEKLIWAERGVTCFGSEPAAMASHFYIIIPYLICRIRYYRKARIQHLIMLGLLLILEAGSVSSTVMIIMSVTGLSTLCLVYNRKLLKPLAIGAFCVGMVVATSYAVEVKVKTGDMESDSFEYLVFGKLADQSNLSTAMRSSTVAVDMKLFTKYPVTGVGLGMQGIWYDELIPQWTRKSREVQNLLRQSGTISNGGGNFFPVYLSAFGIIGILALIWFMKHYTASYRTSILKHDKILFGIYWIGIISAILSMWYTSTPKLNEPICILLTLPLIRNIKNSQNTRCHARI